MFCEQAGDVNLTGAEFITIVRSGQWELVHYKCKNYGQLFDSLDDPGEVRDRLHDPACAAIRAELLATLREWLVESNFRTRDLMAACR